jgi:hypothetical protein
VPTIPLIRWPRAWESGRAANGLLGAFLGHSNDGLIASRLNFQRLPRNRLFPSGSLQYSVGLVVAAEEN